MGACGKDSLSGAVTVDTDDVRQENIHKLAGRLCLQSWNLRLSGPEAVLPSTLCWGLLYGGSRADACSLEMVCFRCVYERHRLVAMDKTLLKNIYSLSVEVISEIEKLNGSYMGHTPSPASNVDTLGNLCALLTSEN